MKLLSVVSARPNFVKLASVYHALKAADWPHEHVVVHTGQHHDPLFSDVFFEQLGVPLPAINLDIHGGTNEEQQQRVMEGVGGVLQRERPDIVLVYGDVNGAVASARAATALGIPVAHIEAGLRSGDLSMPEEVNRIAIDSLATLLFVTEESGLKHLQEDGAKGTVHFVGNTMIDTLIRMLPSVRALPLPVPVPPRYGILTLHRPGNVDDPSSLARIVGVLENLSATMPLIFPVHLRTRAKLKDAGLEERLTKAVQCIDPQPYLSFLRLVLDAHFVLTDSGGIQEETTYLQKKCFTARPNTERPVTCTVGSNELVDLGNPAHLEKIRAWAAAPSAPVGQIPPLWDGHAGERITAILRTWGHR